MARERQQCIVAECTRMGELRGVNAAGQKKYRKVCAYHRRTAAKKKKQFTT